MYFIINNRRSDRCERSSTATGRRIRLYLGGLILVLLAMLLASCNAHKAYLVTRSLLGYIPPPKVKSVGEQLADELERCKKSGGTNCEKQAVAYVLKVNRELERKPLHGRVIIKRDYPSKSNKVLADVDRQKYSKQKKTAATKKQTKSPPR